jgi:hypothetical protein
LRMIPPTKKDDEVDEKEDENGDKSKPAPVPAHPHHHRKVLDRLMEQLELDMTPSKSILPSFSS